MDHEALVEDQSQMIFATIAMERVIGPLIAEKSLFQKAERSVKADVLTVVKKATNALIVVKKGLVQATVKNLFHVADPHQKVAQGLNLQSVITEGIDLVLESHEGLSKAINGTQCQKNKVAEAVNV